MKSYSYTLVTGRVIRYQADDKMLAFLDELRAPASDAKTTENDLISFVYSDANPLLVVLWRGMAPMVTGKTLANPAYRVARDLLERKRYAARGIDVKKLAAEYTLTVSDAAKTLGVHESAVRQAIQAGRLASWIRNGRTMLHPKWTKQFAGSLKGKGKPGPKPNASAKNRRSATARMPRGRHPHAGMQLRIEVEREADDRWIAAIPALRGVMVYGATAASARLAARRLAHRVLAARKRRP